MRKPGKTSRLDVVGLVLTAAVIVVCGILVARSAGAQGATWRAGLSPPPATGTVACAAGEAMPR